MPPRTELRQKLIDQAVAAYGTILPCEGRTLQDCFTVQEGLVMFWFNDESGNTHAVVHPPPAALVPAAS